MIQRVKNIFKYVLFSIVTLVPFRVFCPLCDLYASNKRRRGHLGYYIERVMNYVNRRVLTEQLIVQGVPYFPDKPGSRYEIYNYVFDQYVREPINYLEFGVAGGGSIQWALSRLGTSSHLYGFDSFEGLPSDWYLGVGRGTFSTQGKAPLLTAPNLTFVKGWFEESLGPFFSSTKLKPHLVVHMDADLYAPTKYVLCTMKNLLVSGTIIIFDEYWFLKDEFRAFREFIAESKKRFEYIAISDVRAAIRFMQ